MKGTKTDAGMTVVEVLVVAAMLVVLGAMLYPLISGARRRAADVVCMSRMQAIYVGLLAYIADHDRRYPMTYYWFVERDDPDTVRWAEQIAARQGVPLRLGGPVRYWPPWPPPPPPPWWYTLRVPLNDYVNDSAVWFCPSEREGYPPGPEGIENVMTYTYNPSLAGVAIDQLTWPLDQVRVLYDLPRRLKGQGHVGVGFNVLLLDGRVVKEFPPVMAFSNVRYRWEAVKDLVLWKTREARRQ